MPTQYLLGLDVGGGGGRCLLVDTQTGATTTAFQAWSHPPAPTAGAWAFDLDAAGIWRTLGAVTRATLARAGAAPQDVAGLAATSMRHGTVVLDGQGDILLATPNKDARAASVGLEGNAALFQRTGRAPSPVFLVARLLWMKENAPDAFRRARAVLSISDWIGYLLTGTPACERSQAGESMLLDLRTRAWAADLVAGAGLPENIFPPLQDAGTRLGALSAQAAAHLGLVPGTPVAAGGADTQSGLLGAGVTAPGQIGVVAGTTTPVQVVVAQPVTDGRMRVWTGLHVIPGQYVVESNAGQMGSTLEWMARLMYAGWPNPAAALCAEAANSAPGAHGMLSTIGAQIFNAAAMSLPIDTLTFSAVTLPAGGRADVARAVLEGMAYAVRANVEQALECTGGTCGGVWLTGGMSRSTCWSRILADVLQTPVHVSAAPEATALGAAICAGTGAGLYPDLVAGARALARAGREHAPGADAAAYRELYADWRALLQARGEADTVAAGQIMQFMAPQPSAATAQRSGFRPRIYVTAEVDDGALEKLRELGEVTYAPYRGEGRLLVGDELVEVIAGYHVFITEVDIVGADDLLRLPDLRVVGVCRGNPTNVDVAACTAAGIPMFNTPARNADAVADLAVGFMLMLARRLQAAAAFLHEPGSEAGDMGRMGIAHEQFLGGELWRKTIGVVGGGAIGRRVIARLLPFGARILLHDPYLTAEQSALLGAENVGLEKLLAESDFVTLHAPVTDETRGMIGAEAFARMKPGACLVNTARAALVDQDALLAALQGGRLAAAALDVFAVEPPGADDPLLACPSVIATPHVGGNTREVAAHQGEIVASEIAALLAGDEPRYLLNPAALEGFAWSGPRTADAARLRQLAAGPGPAVNDLGLEAQRQAQEKPEQAAPAEPAAPSEMATPVHTEKKGGLLSAVKRVLGAKPDMPPTPTPAAVPAAGQSARDKMIAILAEFTRRVAADPAMAEFARGKHVVFEFTLKDLDQSFYLSYVDGQVAAGLGGPPQAPDVKLKMSADTLDGMFTGRINATKAAMTGKLSFSGDTGKAMAFQRIQKDMGRLYAEARERVGNPGDLTGLAPAAPAPTPTLPSPALRAGEGSALASALAGEGRVGAGDVRDAILSVTGELYAHSLITATGGNVSARTDDHPGEIWITPSAIFKGDLRPDMLVRIDLDGNLVAETAYSASSERRVHCAIYKSRPDVTAVVHTHAPYTTLMALTGTPFLPISTEAAFLGDIPIVPYIMPGTNELGDAVARALGAGSAVIMQNHGLVVAGSTLRRAADVSDVIEVTAHKLITCRMLGVTPPQLPEDAVKTLREVANMMA